MNSLLKRVLALIGMDGLLHIVASALIASLLQLVMRAVLAILITLMVGALKELCHDELIGKGEPSTKDMLCNVAGIIIVILNHI